MHVDILLSPILMPCLMIPIPLHLTPTPRRALICTQGMTQSDGSVRVLTQLTGLRLSRRT